MNYNITERDASVFKSKVNQKCLDIFSQRQRISTDNIPTTAS